MLIGDLQGLFPGGQVPDQQGLFGTGVLRNNELLGQMAGKLFELRTGRRGGRIASEDGGDRHELMLRLNARGHLECSRLFLGGQVLHNQERQLAV